MQQVSAMNAYGCPHGLGETDQQNAHHRFQGSSQRNFSPYPTHPRRILAWPLSQISVSSSFLPVNLCPYLSRLNKTPHLIFDSSTQPLARTHYQMEQQQPTNNAAAHCRPRPSLHPFPDPKLAAQPSAIQNISHRFSKLYAGNHRRIGLKPYPIPHPQPEPELFKPSISDNFCAVLTKSSSQHERKSSIVKVTDKKPKSGKRDLAKLMFKGLDNEETPEPETGVPEPTKPPPSTAFPFGRRSFCSSQVEIMEFFSSSGAKALAVDMAPFMQIHAVDCARKTLDSLEKFTSKTLALTIKKEFDGAYGPAWHCIVGTSFGSFVTHSVGGFIYFSLDRKFHILLFKTAGLLP